MPYTDILNDKVLWKRVDKEAPTDRADAIRLWILELNKPERKQCRETLQDKSGSNCCLGVMSGLVVDAVFKEYDERFYFLEEYEHLPKAICNFLKISYHGQFSRERDSKSKFIDNNLINMNDQEKSSFTTISRKIRDKCSMLFKELTFEEIKYIKATPVKSRETIRAERRAIKETRKKTEN